VPTECHNDGQNAGYFLRTLWTVLFIGTPRVLHGNVYICHVRVVIYEMLTNDHIRHIRQVVEAPVSRWTFNVGMREAT
jgi:hypothetical protein